MGNPLLTLVIIVVQRRPPHRPLTLKFGFFFPSNLGDGAQLCIAMDYLFDFGFVKACGGFLVGFSAVVVGCFSRGVGLLWNMRERERERERELQNGVRNLTK